jgi:hypothetical protein
VFLGFSNNAAIPFVVAARKSVYRRAHFQSPAAWTLDLLLTSVPLSLICVVLFSSLIYWVQYAPDFPRFLYFMMLLFLIDGAFAWYLRSLAVAFRTQDRANAIGVLCVTLVRAARGARARSRPRAAGRCCRREPLRCVSPPRAPHPRAPLPN